MLTNRGIARDAAAPCRRIAEKGVERFALINGRVQSLSSSPLPLVAQPEPSSKPSYPTFVSPNSDQLNLTGIWTSANLTSV
ncbi:hypothetical protein L1987_57453 [Smallanthus sonchifolius]|uniref:Uncharacterized protein n=1 Tax=Smallanthus sonchifolius TaxID=185202 RepID=A0ACB9DCP2_9ASTR|nr:hypothetical protein L1987_57453 [Smallanthus sonchifolius]